MFQEEGDISKNYLGYLVDKLWVPLKTSDQASKCIQILLPKPKVEIASKKTKDNLFVCFYKNYIEHSDRQICS